MDGSPEELFPGNHQFDYATPTDDLRGLVKAKDIFLRYAVSQFLTI